MSDRVSVTVENGVADVRLNRPEKMNALDPAMFDGLIEVGEAVKADPSVRAVVLSGEGRAFCAGLDFGSFQAMADAPKDRPTGDVDLGRKDGPHHQPRPAGGVRVAGDAGTGHRRRARGGARRRVPDRSGRRHSHHRPRRAA